MQGSRAAEVGRLRAVVLAAGASRRMGHPKAHARWGGKTFLACCTDAGRAAGATAIVVVGGALKLGDEARALGVAYHHNAGWDRGPLSSLQAGLAELDLRMGPGPTLVLSIDRPHLRLETLRRLSAAVADAPDSIWQPAVGGRRGHPIVWPADLCAALCQLPPTATPRHLLARPEIAARRRSVAVADPAIHENLDTPSDVAAAARRLAAAGIPIGDPI